jgi:hypothetical protein
LFNQDPRSEAWQADSNVVGLGEERDQYVIGRQFRQRAAGLGSDASPAEHIWLAIAEPDGPL